MPTPIKRIYGWKPDIPDFRDRRFSMIRRPAVTLPPHVDLREWCGEVLDQGQIGSCTANALAQDHIFTQRKEQRPELFLPSRLFIYFNERLVEGNVESDSGAMIRTGIKVLKALGACQEKLWSYQKDFRQRPTKTCYAEAKLHTISQYLRVDNLEEIRACLASGNPVVFGFSVYSSFESAQVARTGIVPMPSYDERMLGGHAVLAVGYDDLVKRLIVMNSWGASWGDKGFFYLPYGFVENRDLSDDFWSITHLV